ncbi:MAG: immunoglobulin domain-containing protein [Phycisphaerales bacterium]
MTACAAGGAYAQCSASWLSGAGTIGSPGIGGNTARCLLVMPNSDVIVGGSFTIAGGVAVQRIARFSASTSTWSPVGSGATSTSNVYALAALPDGDMLVGGNISMIGGVPVARIARYDAQTDTYSPLGAGLTGGGQVTTILPLPGGDVIVGGTITQVAGINVHHIARYNLNTGVWSSTNSMFTSSGDVVNDLALAPDGTVIVGGIFFNAGGTSGALRIARYNPVTGAWSALGAGVNSTVNSVLVLPDGDVLAGGSFTSAGGVAVNRVARYNPSSNAWSALGSGVSSAGSATVDDMALLPSGDVVMGGTFTSAGGVGASRIARYRPSTNEWFAMGSGLNSDVNAVGVTPVGDAVTVGVFTTAGGAASARAARYRFGGDAIAIAVHPSDTTACVGSGAALTAAGQGAGPFGYQWRRGGVPISYATNPTANAPTLVILSPVVGDAGTYDCVVSNACGSLTTNPAMLTVNESCCDSLDFNTDGLYPDTADIDDFLSVFSGGPCSTGACADLDFNNDGLFPDTTDIDALLSVFSGGPCL